MYSRLERPLEVTWLGFARPVQAAKLRPFFLLIVSVSLGYRVTQADRNSQLIN